MHLLVIRPAKAAVRTSLLVLAVGASALGAASSRASTEPGPLPAAAVSATAPPLASWKIVNYFPRRYSWDQMWTHWDPATIDADFARISSVLHATAVRVNLFPDTFGYPTPTQLYRDRLAQIVGLANAHGLRTQLSLFDWFSSFGDIAGSKTWVQVLLSPYRNDPRIAYIDMQNEINLRSTFRTTTIEWLRQLVPYVKGVVGSVPVTASMLLQSIDDVRFMRDSAIPLDFYDLHYYWTPYEAYAMLRDARNAVAPAPVFVSEFGYSTYPSNTYLPGVPPTSSAQEAMQVHFFRTVGFAAQSLGLPFGTVWTYIDLDPAGGPPRLTEAPAEATFGLFRADGSLKPGGSTIAALFSGQRVDASFNTSFEAGVTGTGGASMPAEWRVSNPASGSFSRATNVWHLGRSSARIGATQATTGAAPAFYMSPVQWILPGETHTLSVWARGWGVTGRTVAALSWYGHDFHWISQNETSPLPTGSPGWTQLAVTATAPAGAVRVEIWLKSSNNKGSVNFDDVSFR